MNVIHGGRKTNPIIETFKCELCNQVIQTPIGKRIIKNLKLFLHLAYNKQNLSNRGLSVAFQGGWM